MAGGRGRQLIDNGAGPIAVTLADESLSPGVAAVELGGPPGVVLVGKKDRKLAGAFAVYLLYRVGADEVVYGLGIRAMVAFHHDSQPDLAQPGKADPVGDTLDGHIIPPIVIDKCRLPSREFTLVIYMQKGMESGGAGKASLISGHEMV